MSLRIFARISAFIGQLPSLSYRESPGSPHEHTGSVNLDVVVAYMLAHAATIRLYTTSVLRDDLQNRLNAALAIGQLAAALDEEEVWMQSQVLMVGYMVLFARICSKYSFPRCVVPMLLRFWARATIPSVIASSFRLCHRLWSV